MIFQVTAATFSVAALFAMAFVVRKFGEAQGWSPETQRKAVHVSVGIHAMLLPLVMDRSGFLIFAVLALWALLILRIPHVASAGPGAAIHSVERQSWGDILFLVAVTVLFLRAAGDLEFYTLPLAVLTLADAAAALVGSEYGRMRFGSEGRIKSIEGTVAFFVTTWVLSVSILILGTSVPRDNVIWLATVIAAMASIIEADSWKGLDNIFIPIGVHSFLIGWGQADPLMLGTVSLLWLFVLTGAKQIARPLHLEPHALRATFIALFLTAGIAEPIIVVLPITALIGHLGARRPYGKGEAIRDLDFVVVLVLLGILWLTAGALAHRATTEFYTMTFAALTAGYAVLALPSRQRYLRIFAAFVATGAVVPAHEWLNHSLALDALWIPRYVAIIVCAVTAAACSLTAACNPPRLGRNAFRWKLAALALALPGLTFGIEVLL